MYDFLFLNPVLNLQFVAPYAYLLTVTNFTGGDSYANLAAGTAPSQAALQAAVGTFPANQANFGSITPVQQNLKNPRTAEWNVGRGISTLQGLRAQGDVYRQLHGFSSSVHADQLDSVAKPAGSGD